MSYNLRVLSTLILLALVIPYPLGNSTTTDVHITQTDSLSQSSNWLSGWQYRKSHTINGASGAGTNYQIKIRVLRSLGIDSGGNIFVGTKCASDFADIRFTTNDGVTDLDYWLQDEAEGIFWVEIDDSLDTNQDIYIYYGNSGASTTSDGAATFLFFDDFIGTSLDVGKWNEWATGGSYSVSSSVLTITGGSGAWEQIGTYSQWADNIAVHAYATWDEANYIQVGIDDRTANGNYQGAERSEAGWRKDNAGRRYYVYHDGSQTVSSRSSSISSYTHIALGWESGSSVRFWEAGVLQETTTSTVPSDDMGVCFSARETTTDVSVDWVFVRKYVVTEPSQGAWGYEETPDSSLVSSWSFNEGSGSMLYDLSGNDNDGDITGPLWTTGAMAGHALQFDGTNDYIEIDDSISLRTIANEYTFEAFFKLSSYGTQKGCTLFQMASGTGGNVFIVVANEIPASNKIRIAAMTESSGDEIFDFNYVIPLNQWVALAAVKSSSGNIELYVNGSLEQTLTGFPQVLTQYLSKAFIGADADSGMTLTDFFAGTIDEIRIYNRTLSSSEISQSYIDFFEEETTSTTTTETTTTETTTSTTQTSTTSTTTGSTSPIFTFPVTGSFTLVLGLAVGGIIAVVVIVIVFLQVRSRPSFGGFDYG